MEKHTKTGLSVAFFLAVVGGLLVAAAGGAVAADVEIANDTVEVDTDTRSVYADLNNSEADSSTNATVWFYGVDEDGNETELEERNVTVDAGNEILVERTDLNSTKYPEYRVVVEADNSSNMTASVGSIQQVAASGGGDGGVGGTGLSIGAVGALAVVAFLVLRGGDD